MDLDKCLDQEFSVNSHLTGMPEFEMAMRTRQLGVSGNRSFLLDMILRSFATPEIQDQDLD